ncbi:NAD(P)-binding protein [Halobacillus sp. A5]|uniref:NAD(P)-binding protein n=1 Tax=Halobacillus sp. A5 TaxID=2880263 RepID=UPI0020A6AD06|nr:NAD(P)-binding protein [Halobacillus sp. A5]MCP3028321.1 NAD(P)-binding protein [Halobacillus sp. A5]
MSVVPLMVDFTDKKVVVVGGGPIAERRVHTLIEGEADIEVISPDVTEGLFSLNAAKKIRWQQKYFSPEDAVDAFLIVAASNDTSTNQAVINASPSNALINCVQEAEEGNVQFPTHCKRGRLSISVSTQGASPILASQIKNDLEDKYDEGYEQYVDFLYEARQLIKQTSLSPNERKVILRRLVEEDFFNKDKQVHMLHHLQSQQ